MRGIPRPATTGEIFPPTGCSGQPTITLDRVQQTAEDCQRLPEPVLLALWPDHGVKQREVRDGSCTHDSGEEGPNCDLGDFMHR